MSNEQPKKPWQSGGIVTGVITLILAILEFNGVLLPVEANEVLSDPETIAKITQAGDIRALLMALAGIAFIYFRLRAQRAIAGGMEGVKDAVTRPITWVRGIFTKNKKE
jgi:hypothetical protein